MFWGFGARAVGVGCDLRENGGGWGEMGGDDDMEHMLGETVAILRSTVVEVGVSRGSFHSSLHLH